MSLALQATKRTESVDAVRAAGKIPAVVYGPHMDTLSIAVPVGLFEKYIAKQRNPHLLIWILQAMKKNRFDSRYAV